MTAENFRSNRRQKFLTEQYFELNVVDLAESRKAHIAGIANRRARGSLEPAGQAGLFGDQLKLLKLHYTAGSPIEELRPLFADAVSSLETWTQAYRDFVGSVADESGAKASEDGSPLHFEDLYQFQLALDMVSLGVLLGEGESLRRITRSVARYRGSDMLFEALIARSVPDPQDNTDFFHTDPYDPLIDAFYSAETPEESASYVKRYLDHWYKAFEGAPWHNGHLKATSEYMPYYGYWSFESAAVAVLYGIDDSSFRRHLVYPKDLAQWARDHRSIEQLGSDANDMPVKGHRLRCQSGKPCPKSGFWFSPAQTRSRRRFEEGELMPSLKSDFGTTIWQWDEDQSAA